MFHFGSSCSGGLGVRAKGNEYSHAVDHIPATNAILLKSHSSVKAEVLVKSDY